MSSLFLPKQQTAAHSVQSLNYTLKTELSRIWTLLDLDNILANNFCYFYSFHERILFASNKVSQVRCFAFKQPIWEIKISIVVPRELQKSPVRGFICAGSWRKCLPKSSFPVVLWKLPGIQNKAISLPDNSICNVRFARYIEFVTAIYGMWHFFSEQKTLNSWTPAILVVLHNLSG